MKNTTDPIKYNIVKMVVVELCCRADFHKLLGVEVWKV